MAMPARQQISLIVAAVLVAGIGSTQFALGKKKNQPGGMDEQKRALHALNRLTFGPRPGDAERVSQLGVDKWIDLQLHPEKIDDAALDSRLASFRTLRMDTHEIVENFPNNEIIKQVAEGKAPMPTDPVRRAVYEAQVEKYEDKQDRKATSRISGNSASGNQSSVNSASGNTGERDASADASAMAMQADAAHEQRREEMQAANIKTRQLLDLPPDQRFREILTLPPEEQHAIANRAKGPKPELMGGMNSEQKETVLALNNPEQVVVDELMQAKLLRAIYSDRQLEEVMTDFWFNHFNVFINKGADRFLLTSYERDAIRPHVLGKFEDLLVATAKSPAMLFYLDNWLSVGPHSDSAIGPPPPDRARRGRRIPNRPPQARGKGKPRQASGLNENYGRELMELHTLSVNGGYSQQDVTEVAKVFTGWTIAQPNKGGGFKFEPKMHEPGDKTVLGHRIKQKGEKEGLEVLHLLARNPQTAHFISQKLAMRFVSDDPPPALVDRMTKTFLKKNGDIREVLRTMFDSPEFWAPQTYRAKVKTPFEFVVSAVRASGAQVDDARQLVGTLGNMGMPLYGMMPPTGYSMKAETWVNSSALLARMNFALGLAAGKVHGVTIDGTQLAPSTADAGQALARMEASLLGGDVSRQTHDTISKQLEDPKITQRRLDDPARAPNVGAIAGLILGSPEFQKR
ncbi:MAG: DUF1800 domain-containing protein [Terriglobales bacterium]